MAEAAFRSVQIGKETTKGTEVNATLVLPVETTSGELTLVRGTNTPDEDYGRAQRNRTLRASHGVKNVTGSVSSVATFQTLPHFLQMALGDVVTTGSGAPYTHTIESDTTADTTSAYTWEVNDDTQDWIGTGIVIPSFELGFDAVAAGENAPWMLSADLQGMTFAKGTATAAQSAPAMETMEGHLTTISQGSTATAFASLTALTSKMVAFSLSYSCEKPPRPYAGTDTYAAHGRRKGLGTVTMTGMIHADTVAAFWDNYAVAGSIPTYLRYRVAVDGASTNAMTVDFQGLITDVHVEPDGRDGERLFSITVETVDDSTLDTDLSIGIINGTASY